MLRRSAIRCAVVAKDRHFKDIVARLDSFEKEVVALKEFRTAVEKTSPEVAVAAAQIAQERLKRIKQSVNAEDFTAGHFLNPEEFDELYQFYALQVSRPVAVSNLLHINDLTDLLNHSAVAHREIAVRLAKRAASLNNAPLGLGRMPSIQQLRHLYELSFHDIRSVALPTDRASAFVFDEAMRRIFLRHVTVRPLMFNGLQELARRENITKKSLESNPSLYHEFKEVQDVFADFIDGRTKLRFLVGNYVYLSTKILDLNHRTLDPLCRPQWLGHDPSTFCGQICKQTSMVKIAQHAVRRVQETFADDDIPAIDLKVAGDENFTFVGIPLRISELVTSLLETAVRHNLNRREDYGLTCTAIHILISQGAGNSDVVVRVSDTAGGIPLHEVPLTQQYLYCCDADDKHLIEMPYSSVVAKSIGGEISIASIEGYGTDRTLYIPVDFCGNGIVV